VQIERNQRAAIPEIGLGAARIDARVDKLHLDRRRQRVEIGELGDFVAG
jgi:hypothetical protein